jgi:hypothetical protein
MWKQQPLSEVLIEVDQAKEICVETVRRLWHRGVWADHSGCRSDSVGVVVCRAIKAGSRVGRRRRRSQVEI